MANKKAKNNLSIIAVVLLAIGIVFRSELKELIEGLAKINLRTLLVFGHADGTFVNGNNYGTINSLPKPALQRIEGGEMITKEDDGTYWVSFAVNVSAAETDSLTVIPKSKYLIAHSQSRISGLGFISTTGVIYPDPTPDWFQETLHHLSGGTYFIGMHVSNPEGATFDYHFN